MRAKVKDAFMVMAITYESDSPIEVAAYSGHNASVAAWNKAYNLNKDGNMYRAAYVVKGCIFLENE